MKKKIKNTNYSYKEENKKMKSIIDNMQNYILTEEDKKELSRDEIQKIEEAFAITTSASNRKQYKKYNKLLKQYSNRCYYYSRQYQKKADLYTALRNMAESDPAKLLRIWDEIVKTGKLKYSDDTEEIFTLLDVTGLIQVYNDIYEAKHCYGQVIDFELYARNQH